MKPFSDISISQFRDAKGTTPTNISLAQVLEDIATGKYAGITEEARNLFLRWTKDTNGKLGGKLEDGSKCSAAVEYDRHKKTMPGVTFSGTFSKRLAACLVEHSGFLVADLDKLGANLGEIRQKVKTDPHVAFGFLSPSGAGLKLGMRIEASRHLDTFYAAESYFKGTYGLKIDASCKDVSRLCFVSHDPDLWINPGATPLPLPLMLNSSAETAMCTEETEDTEEPEDTDDTEVIPVEWLFSFNTIEAAVIACLPDRAHDNNELLFKFARAIKAVEQQTTVQSPQQLRGALDQWYTAADKRFLRHSKEDYMMEFLSAYQKAKYPLGSVILPKVWAMVNEQPLPPAAMQFENQDLRLLVAVCRQLQIVAGSDPFYISARAGAKLLNHKNHTTVAKWLSAMCSLQIIKEVSKGGGKRASRYRYLSR